MSTGEDETPSRTSSTTRILPCYYCGERQPVEEIARVIDNDSRVAETYHTILMRCASCGGALVFAAQEPPLDETKPFVRVYPGEEQPLGAAVPAALQAEHAEAKKCFDAHAYTATVVMVGRTLEGLCRHQGATSRTLASALHQLHKAGIIDKRLLEWADALRVVRNEGAHFTGRQVSREDAFDSLKFCEALLEYIFVVSDRFAKFKARRAKQERPTGTNPVAHSDEAVKVLLDEGTEAYQAFLDTNDEQSTVNVDKRHDDAGC